MDHHESRDPVGLYETFLWMTPLQRVFMGTIITGAGVYISVMLWERGVIARLPLFAALAGPFLFFSGLTGLRKAKERKAMFEEIRKREDELVGSMVTDKREGRNPIRWLNDQGIQDLEIRTLLIEAMNERLKQPRGK